MTHQPSAPSPSPSYHRRSPRPILQRYRYPALTMIALAFLGLTLSGCDIGGIWDLIHTDGDAEAQVFPNENQRVRTFVIETDSFSIETENEADPTPFTVIVGDNFTEYTMTANGILRFTESDGSSDITLDVESADRIIERPGTSGTGTLTIIDVSTSTPPN